MPQVTSRRHWPARLRRKQASEYLLEAHGVTLSAGTLAKLAVVGGGPPYFKDGRFPAYPVADLDKFATARLGRLRRSTSDGKSAGRGGDEVEEARARQQAARRRRNSIKASRTMVAS